MVQSLTFAIPKGRIYDELAPILAHANIKPEAAFTDPHSRKLQFATNQPDLGMIKVRSFDVATFVAFGAAQIGVVGSDVLEEFDYPDMVAPVDLGIGRCRLSVASMHDDEETITQKHRLRVATKYPNITRRHFSALGIQAECIKLNGAIELAPKLGLGDCIVDLVSTGNTLRANGLQEVATVMEVSSRLIINRGALKTQSERLTPLIETFRRVLHGQTA